MLVVGTHRTHRSSGVVRITKALRKACGENVSGTSRVGSDGLSSPPAHLTMVVERFCCVVLLKCGPCHVGVWSGLTAALTP
jgi:hypothetical protein